MYRIEPVLPRLLFCFLTIIAGAVHLRAQETAPALYHAASGDAAGRCLYVIFTFSEQSCFSCLDEITARWCPALDGLKEPGKVGMLLLFNSPRLEIAEKMRERMKGSGCRMPFVVDTTGLFSARLFQSDAAGQVLLADADGNMLLQRSIGVEDAFTSALELGSGTGTLTRYMDSLVNRCTPPSRAIGKETASTITPAATPAVSPKLRVLDSAILEGADTVEMPFGFIYSPADRLYAYIGGMTHTVYFHDSSGRYRSAVHFAEKMNPVSIALRKGELFAAGGESDTIAVVAEGDSVYVADEIITVLHCDTAGRIFGRYRMNPTSPLSIANDVSLGARKIYLTTQRTATASYVYSRGIDFDRYLSDLYDPKKYAAFIDTMKIIREYDSGMRLQRTYGSLPRELATYGPSRSHFWLEFERWTKELPDGTLAFLHCASPLLHMYRDGTLARTVDLRGEYYHPITGNETDGNIPRYAGMVMGEDGRLYCQYTDPIRRKLYIITVDLEKGGLREVAEIGWNDQLLRVDPGGRLHLVRRGRYLQLLVCAPIAGDG